MPRIHHIGRLAAVCTLAILASSSANATIIAVLQSGPILITTGPFAGDFAFNYIAKLSGDERLDPAATDGVTCPGPGRLIQCNPAGTFFTLYDIPGLEHVNVTAANWSNVTSLLGTTPSINGNTFDDPGITNVTFNYIGPVVHANGTDLSISGFQLVSIYNGLNLNGIFTSQSTKDTGDSNGNTDQVIGPVPIPQTTTPEPTPMILIGAGLIGLAYAGRRFRTNSRK